MKQGIFSVKSLERLTNDVYKLVLSGDTSEIRAAGQFINIKIDGLFLRRPISVCDYNDRTVTVIFKVVGKGTEILSKAAENTEFDILTGLGNGYSLENAGDRPLLVGGGVGVPPLYNLCKKLLEKGCRPQVVLGFNQKSEVFLEDEFKALGVPVTVTTVLGDYGKKGFVTDALPKDYTYFYTCGPEPMLKAVYHSTNTSGELSFEERMGCGFGACMGCSCKTKYGSFRICKQGPVLLKEAVLW